VKRDALGVKVMALVAFGDLVGEGHSFGFLED
jgi:hypothetical protein